jgi:hypothetical protein
LKDVKNKFHGQKLKINADLPSSEGKAFASPEKELSEDNHHMGVGTQDFVELAGAEAEYSLLSGPDSARTYGADPDAILLTQNQTTLSMSSPTSGNRVASDNMNKTEVSWNKCGNQSPRISPRNLPGDLIRPATFHGERQTLSMKLQKRQITPVY